MEGSELEQETTSGMTSPISAHDVDDPGDETQRNFRYQHAYGVILLAAASRGHKPYTAIWCEHHEDLLCQRNDGFFDAFQIKTRRPELGEWKLTEEALRKSIKRFVSLVSRFSPCIKDLVFVSNTEFQATDLAVKDKSRLGRSPVRFLEAVKNASACSEIVSPFDDSFESLRRYCECDGKDLFKTLKRVHLVKGPTKESFEAEISHNHLPHLPDLYTFSRTAINAIRDELIYRFYSASSLVVNSPSKHWAYLDTNAERDPVVQAKRIGIEVITECIQCHATMPFRYAPGLGQLEIPNGSEYHILEKKFERGGLTSQMLTMKRRTLTAEQRLLELSHASPEKFDKSLNQLECIVQAECDEAFLEASTKNKTFGQEMLLEVCSRLRKLAHEDPHKVEFERYEHLIGIAGLLTEQCTVWWSEKFDLGAVA